MDPIALLIFLVVIVAVGWVAHYLITNFLPPPIHIPALCVVGLILLLMLLSRFTPIGSYFVRG